MQNFNAMTVIVSGTYGGDNLCQNCADGASIDDSISEFYQGLTDMGSPPSDTKAKGKDLSDFRPSSNGPTHFRTIRIWSLPPP